MLASFRTLCILLLIGMGGCASTTAPDNHRFANTIESSLTPETAQRTATHYLELAEYAKVPRRYFFELYAADVLLRGRLTQQAEQLLNNLPEKGLLSEQRAQHALLRGILAYQQHHPRQASHFLDQVTLKQLPRYLHAQYYQTLADVQAQLGHPLKSAKAHVAYINQERLDGKIAYTPVWQQLNNIPSTTLRKLRPSQDEVGGWVALNQVARQTQPSVFSSALQHWQQSYSRHPARHLWVPTPYKAQQAPTKIALLLPMTGQHAQQAQAIRDGFMTAYYDTDGPRPDLQLYDTEAQSVTSLYKQALEQGADIVVGPLTKSDVKALAHSLPSTPSVPVIALNNAPLRYMPEHFYQFTLSPEEQAQAVASQAFQDGYRHAAIIAPHSALGDRLVETFTQAWENQGGSIPAKVQYDPNNDPAVYVRQLLNVDQSQDRTAVLRRVLQRKIHNQPRRREDIDVFVLMAPEEDARQLRPLFDFYYAEDVPVYAPSLVYSGQPNPLQDRDLNGVFFCDLPWILDPEHPLRPAHTLIETQWGDQAQNHLRLFALGIDAYLLSHNLGRLEAYPDLGFPGTTGTLVLSPEGYITRQMTWAQMDKGRPALAFHER